MTGQLGGPNKEMLEDKRKMNNEHNAKRGTDPRHKPQELNLWIEGSLLCLTFIDVNTFLPFLSFFCTPRTSRESFWNELNSYYVPGILLETEGCRTRR